MLMMVMMVMMNTVFTCSIIQAEMLILVTLTIEKVRGEYMMERNHRQKEVCKTIFFSRQLCTISTTINYKSSWDGDDGDLKCFMKCFKGRLK